MKKTTIGRRLAAATALQLNALGLFERAASDLDAAAVEASAVGDEAQRRVDELLDVRDAADAQADLARERAKTIRESIQ